MSGSTPPASGVDPESVVTKDGVTATLGDWIVLDKVVPTALTNVVSTADGLTSINVTYDSISSNKVKTVKVDYSTDNTNWTNFTSLGGSSNTQVTGLTTDTDYYFRVYPSNIIGEGLVTNISSTTKTWVLPSVPTDITLVNVSEQPVLNWSASTGNPTPTYTIERSTSASSGFSAVSTEQSALTFTDTTSSLSTTYYYRIKSVNASGSSSYSPNVDIIIYPNPVVSYGNAIKNNGGKMVGYNTYTFNTVGSSSFVVDANATIKVLVVGGGGGGAGTQQGGGGSGGVAYTDEYTLSSGTYSTSIGGEMTDSTFDGHTGGGGGHGSTNGGSSGNGTLRSGITGNTYGGYSGGTSQKNYGAYRGGGGGGATQVGGSGASSGKGGDGIQITDMNTSSTYYGGGGGASRGGLGGLGGGGAGATQNENNGADGVDGLGGGAGSGSCSCKIGGDGTVIIRVSEG